MIERLAAALDADDYETAAACLHPECTYRFSERVLQGRQAVMRSFSDNSEWARKSLDRVHFEHRQEPCDDCSGVIRFIDHVEHRGASMCHECRMHVTVRDGVVTELRLQEFPGEAERVAAWLASVGVSKLTPGQ